MVPKHLKDPLTMMARRVHRASHSSILWRQNQSVSAPTHVMHVLFVYRLPVGGKDHSSSVLNNTHDGVPEKPSGERVHAGSGLILKHNTTFTYV